MRYQIRYTRVENTPSIQEYIESKLVDALNKAAAKSDASESWQFTIEVGRDTLHHKKGDVWFAEVNGATHYGAIRARSEGGNIHEAIDLTEGELKSVLSKSKGRIFARSLRAARRAKKMMRLSQLARFFRRGRIRDED